MPQEPSTFACDICCGTTTTTTSTTPAPTTTTLNPVTTTQSPVTTTQNPVTTTSNPVTTTSGPNVNTTTTTSGPLVPCCLRIDVPAATNTVSGPFSTQPTVSIIDTEGRTVTNSNATVTIGAGVANSKIKVFNDGPCSLTGTLTATASSGVSTWNNAGIDGVCDTKCTLTYSSPGLTSAAQPLDLPSCDLNCHTSCMVDDEPFEYQNCGGSINVWVHRDFPFSILKGEWNGFYQSWIPKDTAKDGKGMPLFMYCNSKERGYQSQYSYNTVDGSLACPNNPQTCGWRIFDTDGHYQSITTGSIILNVLRESSSGVKCCCGQTQHCTCVWKYAYIDYDDYDVEDPSTQMLGRDFICAITDKTFFGTSWEDALDAETNTKKLGKLGLTNINDIEIIFQDGSNWNYCFANNGGRRFGSGKNHIPEKIMGGCGDYFPEMADICQGKSTPMNNATWKVTGSKFITEITPASVNQVCLDIQACGKNNNNQFCLENRHSENIGKKIRVDSFAIPSESVNINGVFTRIEGTKKQFHIEVVSDAYTDIGYGLGSGNSISLNTNRFSCLGVAKITTYFYDGDGLEIENIVDYPTKCDSAQGMYDRIPFDTGEQFHQCQYLFSKGFVARPFEITIEGIFMQPQEIFSHIEKETNLPTCQFVFDPITNTSGFVLIDPQPIDKIWMYYYSEYVIPVKGSITITQPE